MYRAHGVSSLACPLAEAVAAPVYTTRGLSTRTRLNIHRFLELGWGIDAIAARELCSRHAVTNVKGNLESYNCLRKPVAGKLGKPSKIQPDDGAALFTELVRSGWLYHDEIVSWLAMERGVFVSRPTVSRYLKKMRWTRHTLRPFSIARNEELREGYLRIMSQYVQEQLVFIDESIFNEKTGWRHHAYGPVGTEGRYAQDIQRGATWAILPAYTVNEGYLPCTGFKEGYYNREEFLSWIQHELLPTLRQLYGNQVMVVILDNVSIHTNNDIARVIREAGHLVQYLPPYSPDYNPIELTFGVLKAWIRRNYVYMRRRFRPSEFGEFLKAAVQESRCDRFAKKHFKYAAGGLYIEQETLDRVREELRTELLFEWSDDEGDNEEGEHE